MIELEQGITVGAGINIGQFPVPGMVTFFVDETDTDYLVSETDDYFIEE